MNFNIHKANKIEALETNKLLTKLIQDEKQYDENISESFIVESFYENYVDDENKCLLVACNDNIVIGYLYGYIVPQDPTLAPVIEAQLDALYIEEEYRQKKIAEELIQEFKSWCKINMASSIEVNVCSNNFKACNLYQKSGFRETKKTLKVDI